MDGVEEGAEVGPDDPEYGVSFFVGLTTLGEKVLVMKLPVSVPGITDEGQEVLGQAIIHPENACDMVTSMIEALKTIGFKPREASPALGALFEVANAKIEAVSEVKREESNLN